MSRQLRQWSDRQVRVEIPLFSCYAFVRTVQTGKERLSVLRTPGVLGFVGNERAGTPIHDEEIESLQTADREKLPCAFHPYFAIGKRVRIRGGSLDGMEGILSGRPGARSLIVSVELLQRSVSIRVEGYDVDLV
jgi:transcription antitermination factor NusG